jgi:hypothetical protein
MTTIVIGTRRLSSERVRESAAIRNTGTPEVHVWSPWTEPSTVDRIAL